MNYINPKSISGVEGWPILKVVKSIYDEWDIRYKEYEYNYTIPQRNTLNHIRETFITLNTLSDILFITPDPVARSFMFNHVSSLRGDFDSIYTFADYAKIDIDIKLSNTLDLEIDFNSILIQDIKVFNEYINRLIFELLFYGASALSYKEVVINYYSIQTVDLAYNLTRINYLLPKIV